MDHKMIKCEHCSRHSRSIYHVGDCPKALNIVFLPIGPPSEFADYNNYMRRWIETTLANPRR